MMNKYKHYKSIILICLCFLSVSIVQAQDDWKVTPAQEKDLSPFMFDDDMVLEGKIAYENSCTSCHGMPGQADYTPMAPSPGDPASDQFQLQTDGSLFNKIKMGRGTMPKFEDVFANDETWNIIAYLRSFNEKYKQPVPDLGGIEIPKYDLKLAFDENVDKLVVKVFSKEIPQPEVNVSAFVKGMFGKLLLGKTQTNDLGIAYLNVDPKIPGDIEGKLHIMVKATKGYALAKSSQKMKIVKPSINKSAIDGRHMWSTDRMAPIWLKSSFFATIFSIWGIMFFIVLGLRNIKKAGLEDD